MTPPTDHPSPGQLADFVSGTVPETERTATAMHLTSCARCAREVAQASMARATLARLPEAAAPPDLAAAALAAASSSPTGRPASPAWYRWGGIAAVAAAFALILTLVLPKIGGGGSADRAASAGVGAEGGRSGGPVLIEISPNNFKGGSLTKLAGEVGAGALPSVVSGPEVTGAGSATGTAAGTAAQTETATACVQHAFRRVDGTLVRLISAKFEGKPAYVAFYEESPGAGQPPDAVTVRVADVAHCGPLSLAQAPLSSAGP